MSDNRNNEIPKWLKELQENSWEVELLISGGAIFALIQADSSLLEFHNSLHTTNFFPGMNIFMIIMMIAIKTLTIGFIFHLLLRALWLSFICINYVFPGGIKVEKLKFQKPYKINTSGSTDLYEQIIKVDRASGLVIYFSILSSIVFIGFSTMITVLFGFDKILLLTGIDWLEYIGLVFPYITAIYYFDFLFFGILRKIPYLTYLTFPLFKVCDWISLRFVFERSLRILNTNLSKIKIILGTIIFFSISLLLTLTSVQKRMRWPNTFDQRQYRWALTPTNNDFQYQYKNYRDQYSLGTIQSDIIKENYIRLFIRYKVHHDELIDKLNTNERYFSNQIEVGIDDSIVTEVDWYSSWQKENENMGVVANIPIHNLNNGKHQLKLRSIFHIDSSGNPEWTYIPFWKDVIINSKNKVINK